MQYASANEDMAEDMVRISSSMPGKRGRQLLALMAAIAIAAMAMVGVHRGGSMTVLRGANNRLIQLASANSWRNRLKFVIKFMYDINADGSLSNDDFESLAIKNTLVERKGKWDIAEFAKNKQAMADAWNEMAELADSDKNGKVTVDEFKRAFAHNTMDKAYPDFPKAFTFFIEGLFSVADLDFDGAIGIEEFRLDCVNRNAFAYRTVDDLDKAYEKLLNEEDKKRGGITLKRYQFLYSQFVGNPDENDPAMNLFGPLASLD